MTESNRAITKHDPKSQIFNKYILRQKSENIS